MIVIRIQGGLGNQLFQYALARSLKEHKYEDIIFDTSFYNQQFELNNVTRRKYILDHFNIQNFEKTGDFESIIGNSFISKLKRLFERNFMPHYKNSYFVEKKQEYDEDIFRIKDNTYIDGYWQSYMYFENITEKIKLDLSIKSQLSSYSKNILEDIKLQEISISVHIRRADYINNYSSIYYQLSSKYYLKGIDFIKKNLSSSTIKIYIFSDDIEWCKDNINITDHHEFVLNQNKEEFEDLILMSNCTHNIIANSTYSWWSAWLNSNPNKIVVCPENWFKDLNINFNHSIYPPTWNIL